MNPETEILKLLCLKLYQRMRGLAPVLGQAEFQAGDFEENCCTDGQNFYLDAAWIREEFLRDSQRACQELLHMLCHCLLGHPFLSRHWESEAEGCAGSEESRIREDRKVREETCDREAWELAEHLWGEPIAVLAQARACAFRKPELLRVDDHSVWGRRKGFASARASGEDGKGIKGAGDVQTKQAQNLRRTEAWMRKQEEWWRLQREQLTKPAKPRAERKAGTQRASRVQRLVPLSGQRGDYRKLLKGPSSWREDLGVNADEFQYSWYSYGLEHYGNLPLIEPLEYREEQKIADLVIVIDTSGSCERELVRIFLEETRGILEQERLFFRRFCLHILQCDNQIQRDDCIRSREEFETYLKQLTISGGGGTDFRPAFERIEKLRAEGSLRELRGILYFTDGLGRYPKEEPDYQVWFVMLKNHFDAIDMPGWVRRLVLEEKSNEYTGSKRRN